MEDDFFLIDIPEFLPQYKINKTYGYCNEYKRKELQQLLCQVSKGYCMYCYNLVKINGHIYGDLEHGIEKSIEEDKLKECIPNIGIACSKCNQKYKRYGEKKRILFIKKEQLFFKDCKENCTTFCNEMLEIRKKYIKNGKILVQPHYNYIYEKKNLRIQYDLLNAKYIPSKKVIYDSEEIEVIEGHINLFQLNNPERRNREVALYCKNVFDNRNLLTEIHYNNYIVDLLREKLERVNNIDLALEICKIIYFANFIKRVT